MINNLLFLNRHYTLSYGISILFMLLNIKSIFFMPDTKKINLTYFQFRSNGGNKKKYNIKIITHSNETNSPNLFD